MNRITVQLGKEASLSYEILIGRNILDRLGMILPRQDWGSRYIIITDTNVSRLHGDSVEKTLRGMGLTVDRVVVGAGEESKSIQTCLEVVGKLMELKADRSSCLIALGGGVIGDLTGFVASIYMRGIPYIQVPTSLLAQVDASIGGKTGIDLPLGKNLLGTFCQPKVVCIDLNFLNTLPEKEFDNGLAEIVKYGIIDDMELFETLENEKKAIQSRDMAILEKLVSISCEIKKWIVEIDERERGIRRILNFGHTIGHAIEAETNFQTSHGQAVSMGMAAEALLSERLGHLHEEELSRIFSLIRVMGLPEKLPGTLTTKGILSRMQWDKKKKGDTIHFVLLKKLGIPFINGNVPDHILIETLEALKS